VVTCGTGVTGIAAGARVTAEPMATCGRCRWCRAGTPQLCRQLHVAGMHRPGGLAELIALPAAMPVTPVPQVTTSPAISCPGHTAGGREPPLNQCRSLPQIPQARTRSTTSPATGSGGATSRSSRRPASGQNAACMVVRGRPRGGQRISAWAAAGMVWATRTIGMPVCVFWCISRRARGSSAKG
jgi:hypothetical protein